jgi:two-component system cell cycle sensor histidine kinase/response regulator CckA
MTAAASNAETILIVEDEAEVLDVVSHILKSAGYRVLEAQSGDAALQLTRDQITAIDLVLTDIILPGICGGELARRLKELKPGIRVLFMSGYTKYTVVGPGNLESVDSFIWKPFPPGELLKKVRDLLAGPGESG